MASSPARRLLQTNSGQYQTLPAAEAPSPLSVDSDVVVILAALLCALICVVGLAAVARCARSRSRSRSRAGAAAAAAQARGLKKKALRALPSLAYEDAVAAADGEANAKVVLAECAICLSEFAPRELVRVLPQCGHAFHVACIDTWLAAHSSCPSCRRVLVVGEDAGKQRPGPRPSPRPMRCRKCDAAVDEEAAASSSGPGGDTAAGS